MTNETVYFPVDALEQFLLAVFAKLNVPPDDARTCAAVLLASDLRGITSHGVGRLKIYVDRIHAGIQFPKTALETVQESETTAVLDGHHGMGMVIGVRAMQIAMAKANLYGLGAVAVRNSTHFGIAGYYAMMAARAGMIGFTVTNARPSVAPTFGARPMFGTNPIAFAAPSDEPFPFVFDAATSIVQRGKIEVLSRLGESVPEGWVSDEKGSPMSSADNILAALTAETGYLLPLGGASERFAGYKGYGLAVVVEILSAALQQGAFLHDLKGEDSAGNPQPLRLGHFFLALDVGHFLPLDEFKRSVGDITRQLRQTPRIPGAERVYTPGEKEFESEKEVRARGVPIPPKLQSELREVCRRTGLDGNLLPF